MNYKSLSALLLILLFPMVISAQKYLSTDFDEIVQNWNGNEFSSHKTLLENIQDIPEFSFMTEVLKREEIQKILAQNEMTTVFIISDAAFADMEKEEKEAFLNDHRRIESLIRYLSIPGRIDKNGLEVAVNKHLEKTRLATLGNEDLQLIQQNNEVALTDSEGNIAKIIGFNFYHKNGLFHIIDGLVFPSTPE